jgi:light-regulated signal transduction histidine kinase (bacteriophytochrome)
MTTITNQQQGPLEKAPQANSETENLQLQLENKIRENEALTDKLDNIAKEMKQFTYIVSHDLQAPLRTITGFLELLEKRYADKLDDTAKQYIGFGIRGAAKMKDLVFDLLEYSRLSTVALEFSEIDLNIVLQEVKEKFAQVIQETGALLRSDHLPKVMADKKQMMQLFEHLLGNAIKFRSNAVPEITITLKQENACLPERQGNWVFAISDNGIGIEPAFFEKIFIIFRKLNTDEVKYGGTGIGLAICKKILELHGGIIRVESEAGKGSTFYFTLPERS